MTSAFAIIGHLRSESKVFRNVSGDNVGQLELRADIELDGRKLEDVIFMILEIEGSADSSWVVRDHAALFMPHLKPVRAYRQYLTSQLTRIRSELPQASQRSPTCPLWMGIGVFIRELETYNEARALATQLRHVTEDAQRTLKTAGYTHRQVTVAMLKAALKAMEVIPTTDRQFVVK